MAFHLARRTRTKMPMVPMVPVWPESGFLGGAARPRPASWAEYGAGGTGGWQVAPGPGLPATRRRFLPPSGGYCRRWVSWPVILAMRSKSLSTWRT